MKRAFAAVCSLAAVGAWVLPGIAPEEYGHGQTVDLKVNKLTSPKTHLGYENYKLKFCRPPNGITKAGKNLGEQLTGQMVENSPYILKVNITTNCVQLCDPIKLEPADVDLFVKRIDEDYNVNWLVDSLPAAAMGLLVEDAALYARGIPIGGIERDTGSYFLYNHHSITVQLHEDPTAYEGFRIVGFRVRPVSVQQTDKVEHCDAATGPDHQAQHMIIRTKDAAVAAASVVYSYDVTWESSPISWATRWDHILSMDSLYPNSVHWFSIVNSLIISVFLTGMVAMILVRALHADIAHYNRVLTEEEKAEEREESGWKLVHGDVFRPPARSPLAFAVFVGIGSQLLVMTASTLVFAAIGFLSPASRGSLMIALLLLFLLAGIVAGYTTARTHKMFNGTEWQRVTLITALGFTGFIFSVLLILNTAVWYLGSTNAVQFSSIFAVLALWLLVSVPLTFLGAFYGFKADKVEFPVRVSAMPRQIPPQPWYLRTPLTAAVGGVLPFGTVFVELFFILTSIWLDQYYYVFGFLLIVFALLVITCAEISIVLTYFQLCAEDYRWWWRSMIVPGASGVYLYAYCIFYYTANLDITGAVPNMLYFGYMGLVAASFTLTTAVVGYLATFAFVKRIYAAVKVD